MSRDMLFLYHNDRLVCEVNLHTGTDGDIDDMARHMCANKGGIVSVYVVVDDTDDYYGQTHTWWDYSYVHSGDRIWRVSSDDLFHWGEQDTFSDLYGWLPEGEQMRTRTGKGHKMGEEHTRDYFPGARRTLKRHHARKVRRESRTYIQEQLSDIAA